MNKSRVSFYVDGFNIYHRLRDFQKKTGLCFKWLDYKSLFQSLLKDKEILTDIYFFTALSKDFGEESILRHNKYITALELQGVKIIQGYFNKKQRKCRVEDCAYQGHKYFTDHEEKQTDVNISLQLLKDAIQDKYDKCFLMSGDNDFAPVLKTIMEMTNKQAGVVTPPYQCGAVKLHTLMKLKNSCYHDLQTNKRLIINLAFDKLKGHSLPEVIKDKAGDILVAMPKEYQQF
ncbi:circadian timing LabA-like protein [Candidatus Termititenax aidoneus]|uniref:Circadian timing LabA-like protein n=1 Tax=Termititenax aidoneus TaxID=2218524 RepID=A0A388TAS5_TERA1|nr:circadian timing LabA-like protein [Candidatus Termititenax aidoneus]